MKPAAVVCGRWIQLELEVQVAVKPMRSQNALYSEPIMMLTVTHDSNLSESHKALSNLKLGYWCSQPEGSLAVLPPIVPRYSHCLLPLPVALDRVVSCMPKSASMSATRKRGRYL